MEKVWIYDNILDTVSNEEIEQRLAGVRAFAAKNHFTVVGESVDRHTLSAYSWDGFETAIGALKSENAESILIPSILSLGKDWETESAKICRVAAVGGLTLSVEEGHIDPLVMLLR